MPTEFRRQWRKLGEIAESSAPRRRRAAAGPRAGVCEELFFRGYALSGLRGTLGKVAAIAGRRGGLRRERTTPCCRLPMTCGAGVAAGLLVDSVPVDLAGHDGPSAAQQHQRARRAQRRPQALPDASGVRRKRHAADDLAHRRRNRDDDRRADLPRGPAA